MGDGTGGTEVKISSTLTGENCIQACIEKKKTDDSINGVTVYKDDRGGCWCENNMKSVSKSSSDIKLWKACFIKPGKKVIL